MVRVEVRLNASPELSLLYDIRSGAASSQKKPAKHSTRRFLGGWTGSRSTSNVTGKKGPLSSSSGCKTTTDVRTVTPLTPPNVLWQRGSPDNECTQSRANTRPELRS